VRILRSEVEDNNGWVSTDYCLKSGEKCKGLEFCAARSAAKEESGKPMMF